MSLRCPECKKSFRVGSKGLFHHIVIVHKINRLIAYRLVAKSLKARKSEHLYNAFKYAQDRYKKKNPLKKLSIMNRECFINFFADYKYNLTYLLFFNESTENYEIISKSGQVICNSETISNLKFFNHAGIKLDLLNFDNPIRYNPIKDS